MWARSWVAALVLTACGDEYEWSSTLGQDPPAIEVPEGGTATSTAGTTVSGGGGEDLPPEYEGGGGSGGARPPEDSTDDPDDPGDEGDPETPDDPEDPGDEGDPEEPSDVPEDPEDPEDPELPDDPDHPGDGGGRMTGGGSLWEGGERVTHGFNVTCDLGRKSHLQVNWDGGHKLHFNGVFDSAACWDDPALDPDSPTAHFDSLWAVGTAELDGERTVAFELLFTDDGEPGDTDSGTITIDGGLVLDVSSLIDMGNHQAHGDPTMPPPESGVPTAAELRAAGLPVPGGEDPAGAGCSTVPASPIGALVLGLLAVRRRR